MIKHVQGEFDYENIKKQQQITSKMAEGLNGNEKVSRGV